MLRLPMFHNVFREEPVERKVSERGSPGFFIERIEPGQIGGKPSWRRDAATAHDGAGTDRTRPPLPTMSTMTQRASRSWTWSKVKAAA